MTETLRIELVCDTMLLALENRKEPTKYSALRAAMKRRLKVCLREGDFRVARLINMDARCIREIKGESVAITSSGKKICERIREERKAREVLGLPRLH